MKIHEIPFSITVNKQQHSFLRRTEEVAISFFFLLDNSFSHAASNSFPEVANKSSCCPRETTPQSSPAISTASSASKFTASLSKSSSCKWFPCIIDCSRESLHRVGNINVCLGCKRPWEASCPKYKQINAHALLPFLPIMVDWLKLSGNDHSTVTFEN